MNLRKSGIFLAMVLTFVFLSTTGINALTDTEFVYENKDAEQVFLLGSFNKWNKTANLMEKKDGAFKTTIKLEDGYHRYKYYVDGEYVEDSKAEEWDPGRGGSNNAMIFVGKREEFKRDFKKYPVIKEVAPADRIIVVGDIHGALEEMINTLKGARLIVKNEKSWKWTGGKTVLVFTGDFVDRGMQSKEVIDLVMELQPQAIKAGGEIVTCMGNHELWQIEKYNGFPNTQKSFENAGLDYEFEISPKGKYGQFMRNMPILAKVNNVLFCHAGFNKTVLPENLKKSFEEAIEARKWGAPELARRTSIMWARYWYEDEATIKTILKDFDAEVIVFGHTRGALGEKGKIIHKNKTLVSIDVGMCPHYGESKGGCLEINRMGDGFTFTAIYPDEKIEHLFTKKLLKRNDLKHLLLKKNNVK